MVEHRNLTGASLHEPKGVELAAVNEVYHADGLGSGAWTDPLNRINNLNEFYLPGIIPDVSAPGSNVFFYIPTACQLTHLQTVQYGAITLVDSIISIYKNGVLQGQTLTVSFTGSGAGVTDSLTLAPVYSFVAGDTLEFRTDGGSTGTFPLSILARFSAT